MHSPADLVGDRTMAGVECENEFQWVGTRTRTCGAGRSAESQQLVGSRSLD
jgi:hypothetical protein